MVNVFMFNKSMVNVIMVNVIFWSMSSVLQQENWKVNHVCEDNVNVKRMFNVISKK